MSEWRIERVTEGTPESIEVVRELFREYHEWLGRVVSSVRLAEEIENLPGPYAPPDGRLLLARSLTGEAAGVVGIRPLGESRPDVCEIKRLYVRSSFRGIGLGRTLAEAAIDATNDLGCEEVVLTTLPQTMPAALALYESLGFVLADPFVDHSHVQDGVEMLFMRLSG